ncbi:hypothetical protein XAC3810_130055 [Xanthomonas citri pv. citri]|uniref:Uncharacterized protein n=1 Tax=Xanthomonas citri pv. citri TaxID=611301 RepID=A0A0U5BPB2_XANCI|nr:hypothetical protein XAC3824_130054 [Xanthomonas citri pv. citri]CEE17560.1 hypothetical protein XAC9322_130052 [Xanthomonas citri pv. citri]CEE18575.1 hypothetical protein XAC1083_140054 [Xanthomonas citri pv. citri]CEE24826.1 hypothetical protein XAC902_150015 [Xanthomonas citri pv. citri]CEE25215.1 hypothetical protein XAC3810_130055 [Xanthomonas citri pv. citri]
MRMAAAWGCHQDLWPATWQEAQRPDCVACQRYRRCLPTKGLRERSRDAGTRWMLPPTQQTKPLRRSSPGRLPPSARRHIAMLTPPRKDSDIIDAWTATNASTPCIACSNRHATRSRWRGCRMS